MKKFILCLFLLTVFSVSSTFAEDQGILFEAGACGFAKWYGVEQISYVYNWDNGISLSADVRIMSNFLKWDNSEPYGYYQAGVCFAYKGGYISIGPMFNDKMKSIKNTGIYGRTGYKVNLWKLGYGKLGLDCGVELSSTLYNPQLSDDANAGTAFGVVFLNLMNLPKVSIGVSWYLPF